jgi:hypothetical protein
VKENIGKMVYTQNREKIPFFIIFTKFFRFHETITQMNNQQQNIRHSEKIMAGRLAPKTKVQYKGKLATFTTWLNEFENNSIDPATQEVILPLSDLVIDSFFGYICLKRKRNSFEETEQAVCPVLTLAIYVFTMGYQNDVSKPLLFGKSSEQ